MARKELGDEGVDAITMIYEKAGRWQEAFQALKKQTAVSDSIDNVVIKNSMQGIREQVMLHESQQAIYRARMIGVIAVIFLLILLIAGLIYFVQTRRRHLKELKSAYRRAMESENMKAAFIQNISHEIRTPLNIISGFAQVIANPDLTESSEERQHIARMMEKNAHHVTALIDEIIGLSLIESTEKMRRDDTMAINKSMRLALKEFEKVISPEIKLKFETTLSDEFTLKTNEKMVLRIINALLENASKYTKEGHIALRADRDDNLLTFTVEDTGCGIPAEEAEHIFERFVKLDSFKEGIGLGLPLSRKLAEQLDGNVILDTSYTDGARFYIKIPIPS
jgi:signal transduction histidine kinase